LQQSIEASLPAEPQPVTEHGSRHPSPGKGGALKRSHHSVANQTENLETEAVPSRKRQRRMSKPSPKVRTIRSRAPSLEDTKESDDGFEVEFVRACYIRKGKTKYFARFLGYGEKDDEEVDEDDIGEFWKKNCSPTPPEQVEPNLRERIFKKYGKFWPAKLQGIFWALIL
jgi:hypothetical protein